MSREAHVRFYERLRGQFPRSTHLRGMPGNRHSYRAHSQVAIPDLVISLSGAFHLFVRLKLVDNLNRQRSQLVLIVDNQTGKITQELHSEFHLLTLTL